MTTGQDEVLEARDNDPPQHAETEAAADRRFGYAATRRRYTVGWFCRHPKFDPLFVECLLARLGEVWDRERYGQALRRYRLLRFSWQLAPAMRILGGVGIAAGLNLYLFIYPKNPPGWVWGLWVYSTVVAIIGVLLGVSRLRASSAEPRFFRLVAFAEFVLRPRRWREYSVISGVNIAGRAARALFTTLQGARRTWSFPPAVADRALNLSYPLIDIDIEKTFSGAATNRADKRRKFAGFLYDTAAVVAIQREDLVPRVRQVYADNLTLRGDFTERDKEYLDPLHGHNRWTVCKDFLYPLAPWLSFLVAIAALIVTR